jgi:hypothetical protein
MNTTFFSTQAAQDHVAALRADADRRRLLRRLTRRARRNSLSSA